MGVLEKPFVPCGGANLDENRKSRLGRLSFKIAVKTTEIQRGFRLDEMYGCDSPDFERSANAFRAKRPCGLGW